MRTKQMSVAARKAVSMRDGKELFYLQAKGAICERSVWR